MSTRTSGTTLRAVIGDSIRSAAQHGESQSPPLAVLWPDPDHTWASVIASLRASLPILTLGSWREAGSAEGPALWLRAALSSPDSPLIPEQPPTVGDAVIASTPVIYLPGVRREDLTELSTIPDYLAPLADVALRSTWWNQSSQNPWTPFAFLSSKHGAELDLAGDAATRSALVEVLPRLLDEGVEALRLEGRLDATRLHARVVPDVIRTLLTWIDSPAALRERISDAEWSAFVHTCASTYGLDVEKDGHLTAALYLGTRRGAWSNVWARYVEAPLRYPSIPATLDQARPQGTQLDLFDGDATSADPHPDSWPSWNREQEDHLRTALNKLAQVDVDVARDRTASLALEHAPRTTSVWNDLGVTPLAHAVARLGELAEAARHALAATTLTEVSQWYSTVGHLVDGLAIQALAAVTEDADRAAVKNALHALHDPWVDLNARAFQSLVTTHGYTADTGLDAEPGTCVVYVDALRLDLAHRLVERLSDFETTVTHRLAAHPTLTPTGQPAVAPIDDTIRATWGGTAGFEAADADGRALKGKPFHDSLAASGVQFLRWESVETGDPSGVAWTQSNDIDSAGHAHKGAHFETVLDGLLNRVASRIQELAAVGWRHIVVVTDHGFLLPARPARKAELPLALTEGGNARKPRVARLRDGAPPTDLPRAPWTWDSSVTMVSAPGAMCFEEGVSYIHGGLSPQECVIPVIDIRPPVSPIESGLAVQIEQVRWTGQRCRIDIAPAGVPVVGTLRLNPGDAASNLAEPKQPNEDGEIKFLVDEDAASDGTRAYVVLLSADGVVIAQHQTVVGGDQ